MYKIVSEALCFDDVLLKPRFFLGNSRNEIDLSTKIGNFNFKIPLISANMSSITEDKTAIVMAECGGLGIIHRFQSIEKQCRQIKNVSQKGFIVGASIGIGESWKDDTIQLLNSGANIICLDVAHAYQNKVCDIVKEFKKAFPNEVIIVGNVATGEAAKSFRKMGATSVKVSIGSGSVCTTRIHTGCGMPTFQALLDVMNTRENIFDEINLIADGGVKNSGDCVKSLAAGANFVMIGSLLAGCDECPGEVVLNKNGIKCKLYKGSASFSQKQMSLGRTEYIEGEETLIPCKGSMYEVINKICEGIRSGVSYCGALNLDSLKNNAEFVRITSAGHYESTSHGVSK